MKLKGLTLYLLGSAIACAGPQKPKVASTVNIEVERVMPVAVSLRKTAVEVILNVQNPMSTPVSIEAVNYNIDTKEIAGVLTGAMTPKKQLGPGAQHEISFRQEIPFPEETKAYLAAIERGTLPIVLSGVITLEDGSKVNFSRQSEVATPSIPKFVVHDAQAARYGKAGIDVSLFLRLINENVFAVSIGGVEYTLELNGKKIKSEQAAIGIRVVGSGAKEYELTTVLDESSYGKKEVKKLLSSKLINYKVTGELELDFATLPFEHVGEIKLAGN